MKIDQTKAGMTLILNQLTNDGYVFILSMTPEQIAAIPYKINAAKSLEVDHPKFVEQTLASSTEMSYLIESVDDNKLKLTANSITLKGTRAGTPTHVLLGTKFPILLDVGTDIKVEDVTIGQDIILPAIVINIPNLA